jgi:hypothetical protein
MPPHILKVTFTRGAVIRLVNAEELWSQRYDASWIDRAVALVIMTFDMHQIHGFGDARHQIKTAQVASLG